MPELPAEWLSTGYATGNATKRLIIARAAEAFAQKGFYGASLRAIAREAGVDHSTLLHHFGNKVALLLSVIEWHDLQAAPPEYPDPMTPDDLADGFVAVARQNQSAPGLVNLLSTLSAEAGAAAHPARPALQKRHRVLISILAATIRSQRERGAVVDDGLSPAQSAAVVVATWEGLQVYDALHPGELDVPAVLGQTLKRAFGLN